MNLPTRFIRANCSTRVDTHWDLTVRQFSRRNFALPIQKMRQHLRGALYADIHEHCRRTRHAQPWDYRGWTNRR